MFKNFQPFKGFWTLVLTKKIAASILIARFLPFRWENTAKEPGALFSLKRFISLSEPNYVVLLLGWKENDFFRNREQALQKVENLFEFAPKIFTSKVL